MSVSEKSESPVVEESPTPPLVHHLIDVWGGVEPSVLGPWPTEEDRDAAALALRAEQSPEDNIFTLTIDAHGRPWVGTYSNGFFEDADESERPGA